MQAGPVSALLQRAWSQSWTSGAREGDRNDGVWAHLHPNGAKSDDLVAREVLTGEGSEPYLFSYVAYKVAEKAMNLANKIQQEQKLTSEQLVVMAGVLPSTEEEIEMSMSEDLVLGSHGQSQEHAVIAEVIEHGSQSLGVSQRQQKLDSKAAGSAAGQLVWNETATRPKKSTQLPILRMSREPVHGNVHPQEYPGGFQGMRFHYERNSEADIIAEIGPEEPKGLEMEVMRRQLREIDGRLCALEDQAAISHQREAVFLTMLLSACIANLWLWMRQ